MADPLHHQRAEAFALPGRRGGDTFDVAGPDGTATHFEGALDDRSVCHQRRVRREQMPTAEGVAPVVIVEPAVERVHGERPDLLELSCERSALRTTWSCVTATR